MISEDDFLEHFGVKGMKWGQRKAVTAEVQAKRDKKAGYYTNRSANIQREIDKLDLRTPRSAMAARDIAATRHVLMKAKMRSDKDAEAKRAGKLSSQQKKNLVVGGAVIGIFIASKMSQRASSLPKGPPSNSVADVIRKTKEEQMYSLTRMHKEGKMDAAQYKAFAAKLNERYDKKIAEALKETFT